MFWKELKGLCWYWLCILIMLCDAFSLHDSCRRVVVGMWRLTSWEQKGPFLPKLEDGSGSSAYFRPPPLLQRSPGKLLTLTEQEYVIYDDIMYYPSKSVLRKIVFYGVWNKETTNHSSRSIGSDDSSFNDHYPTPAFPFLLCLSFGTLILMLATEGC